MADNKRRVVKRSAPTSLADFDEQLWPVTLLLLIASACLAGYIWLEGDFETPKLLSNAWFHLGLVGAMAIALVGGVAMLRGSSQRRLQLGVFLSLAFHVLLLFITRQIYMPLADRAPPVEQGELEDGDLLVSIPDYLPPAEQADAADPLTRPVEAAPQTETKTEVTPQQPSPVDAPKESVPEPEPPREVQPSPLELPKLELTAPRRNEVNSGAALSRKETADLLPTDEVQQRQINRTSQPLPSMDEPIVRLDRQQPADSVTRKPNVLENRVADRPRADLAQFAPRQQRQEDQTAMRDARVSLDRPMSPAAIPTPAAASAGAAAQAAALPNLPQAADLATSDLRQAQAAPPDGSPAPVTAPQTSLTPNAAQTAELQRAETTTADSTAVAALTPRQPSRVAAGAAGAGFENVPFDAPAAAATPSSSTAGGASLEPSATALTRGNQGRPQESFSEGFALPSPVGSGSGPQVGGTTIGPRRDVTQGETGAGMAAAGTVLGRPSRSRAAGPASAPTAAVANAPIAGVPGTVDTPGNAAAGSTAALQPTPAAAGVARSFAGGLAGVAGPAQPLGGSAIAVPTGGSGTGSSGSAAGALVAGGGPTAVTARVDDGTSAGSGTAVGLSTLSKRSPGEASLALPGLGVISVPTASPATDTTTRGDGTAAPTVAAGAAGIRREAAGLPVLVAAPEGPGGLTARVSTDVGIASRQARPESEVAHLETNRLVLERIGGKKSGGGQVRDTAVVGLKQRDPTGRGELARAMGGSEATELAVERGLDFLARHQSPDGSWQLHDFGNGRAEYASAGLAEMQADTAGTGLALLAFLGAGYTHTEGKYAPVVEKGLAFLLKNQKPDGDLFIPPPNAAQANTWFYSHGIASIALCEALGMSRDDELLKGPAQRAIDFIVASQNPELGGWRYLPRIGSDTSVSGWQLMALKSAERVGLVVPSRCYELVTKWLNFAQGVNGDPTRYAYMPQSNQAHQRVVSRVMTAEALLMRQYLGWNRNHPNLTGGADYLLTQLPAVGTASAPDRDSYYWYYATQVMFHMKGEHWRRWNDRLRPILVETQTAAGPLAGSWDPGGEVPDRWAGPGGRIYVTAMHLLMLEVYYRYLPLYQNLEE